MQNDLLIGMLCAELAISLAMFLYVIFKCRREKSPYFILYCVTLFFYSLGYLLEVTSLTYDGAFTALKVEYVGNAFISTFFLLFVLDLCGIKLKKAVVFLMFIIPAVTTVLLWRSRNGETLFYEAISLSNAGGIVQTANTPGAFYYVYFIYSMLCIVVSLAVSILTLLRPIKLFRDQIRLLIIAEVLPLAAYIAYIAGFRIGAIYYPILSLGVTGIFLFVNLVKFNMLDIASNTSEFALTTMSEGFLLIDTDGKYLQSNAAARKIFPFFGTMRYGESLDGVDGLPEFLGNLKEFHENYALFQFDVKKSEEADYYEASISRIYSSSQRPLGFTILMKDITTTKKLLQTLEHTAKTDLVSGLSNRSSFIKETEVLFGDNGLFSDSPISILIIDIDRFRVINETYGYEAGDQIIKQVAESLLEIKKPQFALARFEGGAQFIMHVNLSLIQARGVATRIKNEIAYSSYYYENNIVRCTVSIGVAERIGNASLSSVIEKANTAVHKAKQNGRNRVESVN